MLKLYRAERSDTLVSALATLLRTPLSDPFARETVAVPAKGVERWLNQRLSSQLGTSGPSAVDGISANIAFPSPARLVAESTSPSASPGAESWRNISKAIVKVDGLPPPHMSPNSSAVMPRNARRC